MNLSLDNDIVVLAIAFAVSLLLTIAIKFLLNVTANRLQVWALKTSFTWDNLLLECMAMTRSWFIFIWLFVPSVLTAGKLGLEEKTVDVLGHGGRLVLVIGTALQFIFWGIHSIRQMRTQHWNKNTGASTAAFGLLYTTLQGLLVVGVVLIAMSNLGINIGALITGLGIGGIAVALAAQNILGDFLASLSIVLDKPFEIGDYIVVGSEEGEVENIGVKTTRVRSINGEQLIFSNKDLLESRIRNFKRMWRRRASHKFFLSANTPEEKLRQLTTWVKELFPKYDKLKFERFHMVSFTEGSLEFQLVFWVDNPNHQFFMDHQEALLFDILAKLSHEKVTFPSKNLVLEDRVGLKRPPPTELESRSPI